MVQVKDQSKWRKRARVNLLASELLLCPHDPSLGSWLHCTTTGIACKACLLQGDSGAAAIGFQKGWRRWHLLRHHRSHKHLQSVAALTGCAECGRVADALADARQAPSAEEFLEVVRLRREGGALRRIRGVGKRKKMKSMQSCLAESIRTLHRVHLSQSHVIVLHGDGRSPRYTVRFSAGRPDVDRSKGVLTRRGVLAHVNYVTLKYAVCDAATAIARATLQCIRQFCTEMPGTKLERFDNKLYKHICQAVEMVNADAELTAQLAHNELTNALRDIHQPELPNAQFAGKDFTHAARRALSRPFEKAPEVREVVHRTCLDYNSIVQRITHSDELRDMFKQMVNTDFHDRRSGRRVDNLSNAKHRFDTICNPVQRWSIFFDELIGLADQVVIYRNGTEEGGNCAQYLIYISGGEGLYRCMLQGAFAEYATTIMKLIRFFDTETYEAAEVSSAVSTCIHSLYVLFVAKRCFDVPNSFANIVQTHLQRVRTVVVKNRVYAIGGLDISAAGNVADIKGRVFGALNALVAMAISVLKAEVPEWSVFNAFAVFDVRNLPSASRTTEALARLSQMFKLQANDLDSEYKTVLPRAKAIVAASDGRRAHLQLTDAWMQAESACGGKRHECLLATVLRLAAFNGCTTSGVEHVHNYHQWLFTKRRGSMDILTENDEVNIVADWDETERDMVIEGAREIWCKLSSGHRVRKTPNANIGRPAATITTGTLKSIRVERDKAVASACSELRPLGTDAVWQAAFEESAAHWTDGMTEEITFNSDKRVDSKLQSLDRGHLLNSEIGVWDQRMADERRHHKIDLKRGRMKEADKKRTKLQKACERLTFLPGTSVFLSPSATTRNIRPTPREFLRANALVEVNYVANADVIVCNAPGLLPIETVWECVLTGAIVCNHAAFLGASYSGASPRTHCVYHASITTGGFPGPGVVNKRRVWLSDAFVKDHPALSRSMRAAMQLPNSVWMEATKPEFVSMCLKNAARPKRQRRDLQQIGLMSESRQLDPSDVSLLTPSMFLDKFRVVDGGAVGVCRL